MQTRETNLGMGLTVGHVEDLRTAAGQAGDLRMVAICDDALDHDRSALEKCAQVIADADGGRKGLIAKVTELWTASNRRWESACEDDDSDYQELANDCDDAYAHAVRALEAGDKRRALEALESARSLESDGGDACHAIDAIALVNGWRP